MKKLIMIVALIASMQMAKAMDLKEQKSSLMMPPHIEFRYWGPYGILEYDYVMNLSMSGEYYQPTFQSVTGVFGFQLRRQTGIGLGFSYMYDPQSAFTQMPIFVELRSHYLRSRFTPFSAVQFGYTFPLGNSKAEGTQALYIAQGGVMAGFNVGGRFAFKHNFGMSVNVGYLLLHANQVGFNDAYMTQATMESVLFHNLKFGLAFNF